jgi:hypothetical protein
MIRRCDEGGVSTYTESLFDHLCYSKLEMNIPKRLKSRIGAMARSGEEHVTMIILMITLSNL